MAKIAPFRGVLYNKEKAGVMADLVCPPYDIISPSGQKELYRKSPYNIVRLEYGQENPTDTDTDNRYTRASALLDEWLKEDILHQEQVPALYIYEMEYVAGKIPKRLRGFVCRVKVEDYQEGTIKPHETTLSGPKTDRLNLLRACRFGFSQIYALFSDPQGTITGILADVGGAPMKEVISSDSVIHRIWSVTDTNLVGRIVREMADKHLYIADGHHRYDTALKYRNERREASGTASGEELYDYTAMFLAGLEDPGITILPAHRAVFNLQNFEPHRFIDSLKEYFGIERIDFTGKTETKDMETILDTMKHRAGHAHIFGMRIKGKNSYYLLTLRNESVMDAILSDKSPAYRRLDVSILHHLIIDMLMGIRMDTHKLGRNIEYIKDAREAVDRVSDGSADVVFLMNPTKVEEVKSIALAGECMPQKATYFYPKLVTGLVMHKLD